MSFKKITENVYIIDSPYHGRQRVLGTYLIIGDDYAVIDPGPATQVPGVLNALKSLGVTSLKTLLLTHIHLDHAAGCWKMLDAYPEAYIHCHPRGSSHMADPSKIQSAARKALGDEILEYGEIRGVPPDAVKESVDNERLSFGEVVLIVYWTPGHSTHSQSYYEPEAEIIFVGDAAGHFPGNHGIIIPASPPPHNPQQAMESLDKLIKLKPRIIGYSHFGFYDNATERLNQFRDQTELWTKISIEGVEDRLALSEIFERVKEEDNNVKRLAKIDLEMKGTVYSSLVGFVEYAKWLKRNQ